MLLNWLQTIHSFIVYFKCEYVAFTWILLDYYINARYIVTSIRCDTVCWVFGKRAYRLEAALAQKAAWCRGLTRNCERRDHADSRVDTWRVLKTHRSESIYALRFSLANTNILRIATQCMVWTISVSILFPAEGITDFW